MFVNNNKFRWELHPGGVALRSSNLLRKNLILFLSACTVSCGALSNRSRERRDNVAHAWNISERFYCDRVPLPDWYARVSVPKKFCRRVVCLTATLSRARSLPPAPCVLAAPAPACRALLRCCLRESRWRRDARCGGTRLHTRLPLAGPTPDFKSGFLNVLVCLYLYVTALEYMVRLQLS